MTDNTIQFEGVKMGLKQSKDAVEAYMNGDPELMKQYQASYDYKTANGIKTY